MKRVKDFYLPLLTLLRPRHLKWLMVLLALISSAPAYAQWHIPVIPGPGPNTANVLPGRCLNITSTGPQRGVAWDSTQLDLTLPFDIWLSVNLGPFGGDGLALVLQNSGLNSWGAGGNALGFGNALPADPFYNAIIPSIAFELDTWDNSPAGVDDLPVDHVAIHRNGNMALALAGGPVSAFASNADITDNVCRWFRVTWNPTTQTVRIYYDNVLRITANINLITVVFAGNPMVWWGITGSSGGAPMNQTVCVGRNFAQIGPDRSMCLGDTIPILASGGGSCLWSQGPPLLSNSNIPNPLFTAPAIGGYNLDILITNVAGCTDQDTALITVEDVPTATTGGPFSVCMGDSAQLGSITFGGVSYLWSPPTDLSNPIDSQPWWVPSAAGSTVYQLIATNTAGVAGCADTATVTATALATPTTTTTAFPAAICSGQTSTLTTAPLGGTGPYTYAWTGGGITASVIVGTAGTYYVTVADVNLCQVIDSIVVTALPDPIVQLGADISLCPGDSILLDAGNAGSNFLWNTGQSTQTVWQLASDTFWVRVTNGNGCIGRDTMVFGHFPPIVVNLGNDATLCPGDSLVLDAGNPGSVFIWSTGANTQTIVANIADTFIVIVMDANLCQMRDTLVLAYSNTLLVALGNDTARCMGDSILLDAGHPGSTYFWSTTETTQQIWVAQGATYDVAVTSPLGCQGFDTINVVFNPPPIVYLGADTTICGGATITLNAGNTGSTFLWNTGQISQTITVDSAGTYSVTVTSPLGCQNSDPFALQVSPIPVPNLGPDDTICVGDSVLLDVGATVHAILWSNGSTAQAQFIATAGAFWVCLTDNLGCTGFDTCTVAQFPLPSVSFGTLQPAYCITDPPTQLTGQPNGGNFSGAANSSGNFDPALNGIGQQTIAYTFTDNLGCTVTVNQQTIVVQVPTPSNAGPDLLATGVVDMQANFPIVGTASWLLPNGGGFFSDDHDPTAQFTPDHDGQFPLVWIIENAPCPLSSDTVWLTFEGLNIPNGFSPNNDGLNDHFVIRGIEGYPGSRLMIFNRWGNQVWASENYQNEWSGLNDSHQPLTDDTYYYVLEYGGKKASSFVVLKR